MLAVAISFWLGAFLRAYEFNELFVILALLAVFCLPSDRFRLSLSLLIGYFYFSVFYLYSFPEVKSDLFAKKVVLSGQVKKINKQTSRKQEFIFKVRSLNDQPFHQNILLSFYQEKPRVVVGEAFKVRARLKPIRGFGNIGSRRLQLEYLAKGVILRGTVSTLTKTKRAPLISIERLRRHLLNKLDRSLYSKEHLGVIQSLSLGERQSLSTETKKVFRETGTSHLMAISGLHVGLIAAFFFFLGKKAWQLSSRLCLLLAAPRAASLIALFFSVVYSALAGFSIPTQRALVMLSVFLISKFLNLKWSVWNAYAVSLILVIVINPFSLLSPGFYLSFYAVFVLLFSYQNKSFFSFVMLQVLLLVALSPLSLFYFSYLSLSSIPANLIAIPVVAWCLVPLIFVSVLGLMVCPFASVYLLNLSQWILSWLIGYLSALSKFSFLSIHGLYLRPYQLFFLLCSVVIFLIPKRAFLWPFSFVFLLPVFFPYSAPIKKGEAKVHVLDVGQGSAVLIQTKNHTVLYDAGPKWYGGGDAARSVILPFFKASAIMHLDLLIISHQDSDHSGGKERILKEISVAHFLENRKSGKHSCFYQDKWIYDDVEFSFLKANRHFKSQNNRSCVLKISVGQNSLLLTGDIEHEAEKRLIKKELSKLKANYLSAPHHGSNSSSSEDFIQAVNPKVVIFSAGFLNRFHFPRPEVVRRYRNVEQFNTAECGTISFVLTSKYQPPRCNHRKKVSIFSIMS